MKDQLRKTVSTKTKVANKPKLLSHLTPPYRLNVGCGRNIREGWVNIDYAALPGVDIVCDLEKVKTNPIDLPESSVDYFHLSHVLEHIKDTLGLMEELWRLARPDAAIEINVPFGSSDDAWEDPTHVRPYFLDSFGYFSQTYYWRADYGYRGDWQPKKIVLRVNPERCKGLNNAGILDKISKERNMVYEMTCFMAAVKPIRQPLRELQAYPEIEIIQGY